MDLYGEYSDYIEHPPTWRDMQDLDKKLETIEDFFKMVITELYGENNLDAENLEFALDEIAHQLDLKLPITELKLTRQETPCK